ncbi:MAG: hypothetical protein WCO79_03470 [bacterium]
MNTIHNTHHESPALAHEMRPVLPSFGKLLERTWNFFTEHAKLFALVGLPVFVASTLSTLPSMANLVAPDLLPVVVALNGAVGLVMKLVYVALSLLWPLALVRAVINRRHGKELSMEAAYEPGWEMLGQYAIALILTSVISCLAMFVFLIPGIYLQIAFSFVLFVLVAEGKRGASILTTSWYRVKGYWWPVFGRLIGFGVIMLVVLVLVSAVLAPLVSLLFGFAHINVNMYHIGNLFGQAVQVFLVMPLFYVFLSELYHSLHSINGKDLSITEHRRSINVLTTLSLVGLLAAVFWAYFLTAVLSPVLSHSRMYRGGMMGGYRYHTETIVRPY